MNQRVESNYLVFRRRRIGTTGKTDVLSRNNALAVEVARPLFDAGFSQIAVVERCGFRSRAPLDPFLAPNHYFILMLQGRLEMRLQGRSHTLRAGELTYWSPGAQIHCRSGPKAKTWWVYFCIQDAPAWSALKTRKSFVRKYEHAARVFLLVRSIMEGALELEVFCCCRCARQSVRVRS